MTTLNLQVGASADDAWQNAAGTVSITSGGNLSSGNMWFGCRFQNVTVPQGATIISATLQIYAFDTANDDLVADIYFEAADNAAAFTTGANDISNRTLTGAGTKVSVSQANVGVGFYSITGLGPALAEVIARPGWASGNAVVAIVDGITGIAFAPRHYDGNASQAAKLDIDYEVGKPVHAMYYARMRAQ